MPKINTDPHEQGNPIGNLVELLLNGAPTMVTGVNRKVNIGNYENIDVYSAIVLPMPEASGVDVDTLKEIAHATAELGFSIVSQETAERYDSIKNFQHNGS